LRVFIETVGLIGGPSPKRHPYRRDRNPEKETPTTNQELIAGVLQIAREEVRRYLHSIIVAATPEWNRKSRGERIKAGLAEAKRNGQRLGRPEVVFDRDRAAELRKNGASIRDVARELGVPTSTVHRALSAAK
jgi:DNA invertase Pin-like site-specific DNA recombinase